MKQIFPQPLAVTVAGLFAAGCGDSLATGDYAPPYVTLNGTVAYSTGTMTAPVSVAILWQNDRDGDTSFAGQLGVLDKDLTSFKLGLDTLPPEPAIHPLNLATAEATTVDPALRFAVGTILAFADNDGNGKLDLVSSLNESSPDRVLGAITNVDLFFLAQGRPADPTRDLDLFPTTTGFSLVQRPIVTDPTYFECGWFTADGHHFQQPCGPQTRMAAAPLALDAPIEMTLPSDAQAQQALQGFTCSTFWGLFDYPDNANATLASTCDNGTCPFCRGINCPLDVPPPNAELHCNSDGTAYVYKLCTPVATQCGTRICHYGHGEKLLTTGTSPVGWPCA